MLDPSKPTFRGTLDGGPTGRVQWNEAILLAKRCKLDIGPLDEAPRPRRGKVMHLLYNIVLERNTNDLNQETKLEGELMFLRTILECMVQGRVRFVVAR